MTNYNERLDEVLDDFFTIGTERHISELKQAITSLIKELVAEAKPTNSETQRGSVTVYGDLSERELNIIDQFEQNLLKELDEK